jgi:hypothetical protein
MSHPLDSDHLHSKLSSGLHSPEGHHVEVPDVDDLLAGPQHHDSSGSRVDSPGPFLAAVEPRALLEELWIHRSQSNDSDTDAAVRSLIDTPADLLPFNLDYSQLGSYPGSGSEFFDFDAFPSQPATSNVLEPMGPMFGVCRILLCLNR